MDIGWIKWLGYVKVSDLNIVLFLDYVIYRIFLDINMFIVFNDCY